MSFEPADWIRHLEDEDLVFIKRFVLASGSLKELGTVYGISYPTVRLRLDRLITKIRVIEDHTVAGPFERLLRCTYAEGRIDNATLKALLDAHRREMEGGR